MVASIALAALALRAGFVLRRARAARRPAPRGARQRHLRLAKTAVVLVLIGFVGGSASAVWLRGWSPFATLHGVLGALVLALFAAAAVRGWRLERGRRDARQAHALFGALAVLGAAVAAIAGFVLLP
jgi:polyferredoxin